MPTTTKSEDYWIGDVDESAFAGGDSGAAYAETEPANTAALTSAGYPFNEAQEFPIYEWIQEGMDAAGQKLAQKQTMTKDKTVYGGKRVQTVQGYKWIDKAMTGTDGAVPTDSWCSVFKDGQRLRGAYGNYTTEYVLDITKAPDLAKETVTHATYNVKTVTDGNFSSAKAWDTTDAKKHSDWKVDFGGYQDVTVGGNKALGSATGLATTTQYYFKVNIDGAGEVEYDITTASTVTYTAVLALMNAKITGAEFYIALGNLRCRSEGTSIALAAGSTGTDLFATLTDYSAIATAVSGSSRVFDFESINLTVTKGYTEKQGGQLLHKYPLLNAHGWELTITTFNYDSVLYLKNETEAASLVNIDIRGWGKTLTLVNMKVKNDSRNIKEVPIKGQKAYACSFDIGGDSSTSATA